jgi:hypothetical protein
MRDQIANSGFSFGLHLSEVSGIEGQSVRFIERFEDGTLRELAFDPEYHLEVRK